MKGGSWGGKKNKGPGDIFFESEDYLNKGGCPGDSEQREGKEHPSDGWGKVTSGRVYKQVRSLVRQGRRRET